MCQWRDADCFGRLEVDHIVARDDGGTDELANLRLLCSRHHKKRHNGMTGPGAKPAAKSLVITRDYTRRRTT